MRRDRQPARARVAAADGFSLIETLLAIMLLAIAATGVAQLAFVSARANRASRDAGIAQQAARDKLEQLRSLAWTSDAGLPVTDWSTDLTVTPPLPSGGVGLGVSPGDTLGSSVAGYCDALDWRGTWVGGCDGDPPRAAWIRRWSVDVVSGVPDAVLLQVIVVPARQSGTSSGALAAARAANGTWLATMRVRRQR